jgi:hypothetical protein
MNRNQNAVNDDKRKRLVDVVEQWREGFYHPTDVAFNFVYAITDTGDASLLDLAPDEIKEEIFDCIRTLREEGHFRTRVAGMTGEVDQTERLRRLAELLGLDTRDD